MFVVIVGSREWKSEQSKMQVHKILEELRKKYSGMVIVSSSCDMGVGAIVKEQCLKDKKTFQFIDIHMRVFADLPRTKLSQAFYARNAALAELGEEFHVCVDKDRRGAFEDLIERLERMEMKRPLMIHLPEEGANGLES